MAAEMEAQTVGGANPHHEVTVATETGHDWSSMVNQWLSQRPTRPEYLLGDPSCCIFRVPQTLVKINPKAYLPRIVSIGPYHHGREYVQMIEEHKPRLFSKLVSRTEEFGVDCHRYFDEIASKEIEIKDCYSEPLNLERLELIGMMVLDGCFIIEFLRAIANIIPRDPLFNKSGTFPSLTHDFFHLENQVPFSVLQKLYDISKGPDEPQLVQLTLRLFDYAMQREPMVLRKLPFHGQIKHLLHLRHLIFVLDLHQPVPNFSDCKYLQLVPSVTKLRHAGIKFKPRKCHDLLKIQFKNGVLEIPPLTIDELTISFLLNCVAFERCYRHCSEHVTSYLAFMGCLTATEDDANYLSDHHVLENYYGTNAEVASFFSGIRKEMEFDIGKSHLAGLMAELNWYQRNRSRVDVWWTGLKLRYFDTPWSMISAAAASLILMLTLIQSFMALYAYARPPKQ